VNLPSVLSPESPQAQAVLSLFWLILAIAGFIFLTVTGLVITNIVRFRRREPIAGHPRQFVGDVRLEIIWTVVPLLIVTGLFLVAIHAMRTIQPPVQGRQPDLEVTAHQWWWEGHYPASGVVTANEFHLPIQQTLLLRFRSGDVIHDWWVPQLGRKIDIFPNRFTHLWMKIEKAGTYLGTCDEFCGSEHAWMRIRVVAESPADHEAWLARQKQPAAPPATAEAGQGAGIFLSHTCVSCHTVAGMSTGTVGPNLTHVGSRQTLAAGALENNARNAARWVQDAQSIKPDCHMPSMWLSDEEAQQVAAYLEGLK
jgi:cytochrome c oxidase subunit 2